MLSSCTDIQKILREFYGFRASVLAAEAESSAVIDLGNLEQLFKMKGEHELEGNDRHVVSAVDFLRHMPSTNVPVISILSPSVRNA